MHSLLLIGQAKDVWKISGRLEFRKEFDTNNVEILSMIGFKDTPVSVNRLGHNNNNRYPWPLKIGFNSQMPHRPNPIAYDEFDSPIGIIVKGQRFFLHSSKDWQFCQPGSIMWICLSDRHIDVVKMMMVVVNNLRGMLAPLPALLHRHFLPSGHHKFRIHPRDISGYLLASYE
ncbi:hypothetical protein NQ317_013181 [Molorchus minor]|uniref:Uncharacterized protein n=1 Tax=Molorchus minor TaxID=1323400 RepID=A0ABQ9J6L6_9CUCU|nr:hypothetical protein NQ317_013181 [Molorchus minor]